MKNKLKNLFLQFCFWILKKMYLILFKIFLMVRVCMEFFLKLILRICLIIIIFTYELFFENFRYYIRFYVIQILSHVELHDLVFDLQLDDHFEYTARSRRDTMGSFDKAFCNMYYAGGDPDDVVTSTRLRFFFFIIIPGIVFLWSLYWFLVVIFGFWIVFFIILGRSFYMSYVTPVELPELFISISKGFPLHMFLYNSFLFIFAGFILFILIYFSYIFFKRSFFIGKCINHFINFIFWLFGGFSRLYNLGRRNSGFIDYLPFYVFKLVSLKQDPNVYAKREAYVKGLQGLEGVFVDIETLREIQGFGSKLLITEIRQTSFEAKRTYFYDFKYFLLRFKLAFSFYQLLILNLYVFIFNWLNFVLNLCGNFRIICFTIAEIFFNRIHDLYVLFNTTKGLHRSLLTNENSIVMSRLLVSESFWSMNFLKDIISNGFISEIAINSEDFNMSYGSMLDTFAYGWLDSHMLVLRQKNQAPEDYSFKFDDFFGLVDFYSSIASDLLLTLYDYFWRYWNSNEFVFSIIYFSRLVEDISLDSLGSGLNNLLLLLWFRLINIFYGFWLLLLDSLVRFNYVVGSLFQFWHQIIIGLSARVSGIENFIFVKLYFYFFIESLLFFLSDIFFKFKITCLHFIYHLFFFRLQIDNIALFLLSVQRYYILFLSYFKKVVLFNAFYAPLDSEPSLFKIWNVNRFVFGVFHYMNIKSLEFLNIRGSDVSYYWLVIKIFLLLLWRYANDFNGGRGPRRWSLEDRRVFFGMLTEILLFFAHFSFWFLFLFYQVWFLFKLKIRHLYNYLLEFESSSRFYRKFAILRFLCKYGLIICHWILVSQTINILDCKYQLFMLVYLPSAFIYIIDKICSILDLKDVVPITQFLYFHLYEKHTVYRKHVLTFEPFRPMSRRRLFGFDETSFENRWLCGRFENCELVKFKKQVDKENSAWLSTISLTYFFLSWSFVYSGMDYKKFRNLVEESLFNLENFEAVHKSDPTFIERELEYLMDYLLKVDSLDGLSQSDIKALLDRLPILTSFVFFNFLVLDPLYIPYIRPKNIKLHNDSFSGKPPRRR